MIENRNVNIITDADSKKLVLINDIRFKDKRQIDWDDVKQYLERYVGNYYEIEENAERIYIGSELPEEYTESESRKSLLAVKKKQASRNKMYGKNPIPSICSMLCPCGTGRERRSHGGLAVGFGCVGFPQKK